MSDLTTIAENIRAAMDAMERAQQAEEALRTKPNQTNYKTLLANMETVIERLTRLNAMLTHEHEVALDELSDALSRAFALSPTAYRHAEGHHTAAA